MSRAARRCGARLRGLPGAGRPAGLAAVLLAVLLGARPARAAEGDCRRAELAYARGQDLFASGQHLLAAVHFSQASVFECTRERTDETLYAYALSMYRLGERAEVLGTTRLLIAQGTPEASRRARLLQALAAPELARVEAPADRARLTLWTLRLEPERYGRALAAEAALAPQRARLGELGRQLHASPTRSAVAAGLLSGLVPGLGQAYVGTWQSAAVAFVLNGLFLGATVELVRRDLPFAAGAAGLALSVTWVGNIVNAAEAAALYNRAQRREAEAELERALLPELVP